jgi:LysM repeat protein
MSKNLWLAGVLLVMLALVVGLTGCERAKPAPTPTSTPGTASGTATTAATSPAETAQAGTPAASPEGSASITAEPTTEETPTTAAAEATPAPTQAPATVPVEGVEHVVAWGETIEIIASQYGVSAEDIVAANNLTNPDLIRAGDVLIIPGVEATSGEPGVHIVRQGETLQSIASMYGTTVEALAMANGIVNTNYIWVGQRLTIPGATTSQAGGQTYVVQVGDTLSSIAVQFGTTAYAIAYANNLPNVNFIYVGQTLLIP